VQLIQDGELGGDLLSSTLRWLVGFIIGGSLGLIFGSAVGLSRLTERILDTSVQMLRTVPFLALAPLLVLWLGLDEPPKIALVALASFFPLYINTFAGIRNVDRKLIEVGQVYQLSQRELLTRVILPAAVPEILTGVRYALAVAWLALVIAELLGSTQGLGFLRQRKHLFNSCCSGDDSTIGKRQAELRPMSHDHPPNWQKRCADQDRPRAQQDC
jgi:sulfonate transport system permease protein